MSNTEALRAALQAAREARDAIPPGAERSALNVALDRLDVALSAAGGLAQPAASGEPVAWRITQGARVFYVSADEFRSSSYDYGEMVPLYTAQPAPAPEVTTGSAQARMTEADEARLHVTLGGVFGWKDAQPAPARVPLTDERLNSAGLDYALADSFSSGKAEWVAQDIADAFKAGARAAERYYAAAPTAPKG